MRCPPSRCRTAPWRPWPPRSWVRRRCPSRAWRPCSAGRRSRLCVAPAERASGVTTGALPPSATRGVVRGVALDLTVPALAAPALADPAPLGTARAGFGGLGAADTGLASGSSSKCAHGGFSCGPPRTPLRSSSPLVASSAISCWTFIDSCIAFPTIVTGSAGSSSGSDRTNSMPLATMPAATRNGVGNVMAMRPACLMPDPGDSRIRHDAVAGARDSRSARWLTPAALP